MGFVSRWLAGYSSKADAEADLRKYRERLRETERKVDEQRKKLRDAQRQADEDKRSYWPDPVACRQAVERARRDLAALEQQAAMYRRRVEELS